MAWGLVQLPDKPGEWSVYAKEAYYSGTGSRVRRFAYRKDGLVALTADAAGGEAVTRPITFAGSKLILNARTGARGSIRVELQDADGQPLAGFGAADAKAVTGDHLAIPAGWSAGVDVSRLAGTPIRARFMLIDAELFSLRFE
jgi:hypothetical protein